MMIKFKYFDEDVKQLQNLIEANIRKEIDLRFETCYDLHEPKRLPRKSKKKLKKAMKAKMTLVYEFYQSDPI